MIFFKSAYFLKAMAKAQAMQKLWNEKKIPITVPNVWLNN